MEASLEMWLSQERSWQMVRPKSLNERTSRGFYINDLDSGVKRKLSKFADDTKLGGKVDSRGGGDQIQESIDSCIDWAKDWQR